MVIDMMLARAHVHIIVISASASLLMNMVLECEEHRWSGIMMLMLMLMTAMAVMVTPKIQHVSIDSIAIGYGKDAVVINAAAHVVIGRIRHRCRCSSS
jgi:hypothetical protein